MTNVFSSWDRQDRRCVFLAALTSLSIFSCAHSQPIAPAPPGYGVRKTLPAEVCMPAGEQLWLSRLRCPDGQPIEIVSPAERRSSAH